MAKKRKKMSAQSSIQIPSADPEGQPVTRKLLWLVRDELKSSIQNVDKRSENRSRQLEIKMEAGFSELSRYFKDVNTQSNKSIDSRFDQTDAKFKDIDSRFNQIDAKFDQIDAKFDQIDAKFDQIEKRFDQIDARFSEMEARFDEMDTRFQQMQILLEEQTSNNRIVLEGLQALWQRQERIERSL